MADSIQPSTDRFARSAQLFARAQRCLAGGVNSGIRRLEEPVPLYFVRGRGSRLWDVDGNEYIDFQNGQGALLFGHAPEGLASALGTQAGLGTHWAAQCELELEVAERLQRLMPSAQRVRFTSSATEAVQIAFRLARAHTGKPLILKFEGHYHGWTDEGLIGYALGPDQWGREEQPAALHPSQGVINAVLDHFVVARWNDIQHLRRRVRQFSGRLAGIVFEPMLCNTCCIEPGAGLLHAVRELCDAEGALMIADETITGLRFGVGGAQSWLGLKPDLTILGKAIGGGVPLAALVGTAAAFSKLTSGQVVHGGTLNGNPLCLSASRWCLDQIANLGERHPGELMRVGRKLMAGLRALADRYDIPLRPQGPGPAFHTVLLQPHAPEGLILDYRDYVRRHDAPRWTHLRRCLLESGVRAIERGVWYPSLAHNASDLDEALLRAEGAFALHAADWKALSTDSGRAPA